MAYIVVRLGGADWYTVMPEEQLPLGCTDRHIPHADPTRWASYGPIMKGRELAARVAFAMNVVLQQENSCPNM